MLDPESLMFSLPHFVIKPYNKVIRLTETAKMAARRHKMEKMTRELAESFRQGCEHPPSKARAR